MPPPPGIFCLTCDYDLKALPTGRCPECGNWFDPSDSATFATLPRHHRGRWLPGKALLSCSVAPGFSLIVLFVLLRLSDGWLIGRGSLSKAVGIFTSWMSGIMVIASIAISIGVSVAVVALSLRWAVGLWDGKPNHRLLANAAIVATLLAASWILAAFVGSRLLGDLA